MPVYHRLEIRGRYTYFPKSRRPVHISPATAFVAAEEAEAGMAEMSKVYDETGRELYMGAGDREHD